MLLKIQLLLTGVCGEHPRKITTGTDSRHTIHLSAQDRGEVVRMILVMHHGIVENGTHALQLGLHYG
jgi:hypothetical protein